MAKILVVDDERSIRNTIKELLDMEGHTVDVAVSAMEALDKCASTRYELVVSDIKMPEIDGIELLSKLKGLYADLTVVMISGHGDIATAVDCIKQGAFDFIEKPIEMNRFLLTIRNATERDMLVQEAKVLKRRISKVAEIIGSSQAICRVKEIINKVAPTEARVLITGSNGTGKELIARWLHELSPRASAPFVEVNCAAISAELIESELFGHEKGAFTSAAKLHKGKFEQAEGGTIFLDEIGDMSLAAQAKVLRALQERKISRVGSEKDIEINVRVLAATNKNLAEEIDNARFREDLYHRLSVIVINSPDLVSRREDIGLLINHFLGQIAQDYGARPKEITTDAIQILESMPWTGNIRELRNVVERLVILGCSPITADDVTLYVSSHALSNKN